MKRGGGREGGRGRCTATLLKKVNDFPVPSGDVTNQPLPGWEQWKCSRPERVCLVTSRLGAGKSFTFFYSVGSISWLASFMHTLTHWRLAENFTLTISALPSRKNWCTVGIFCWISCWYTVQYSTEVARAFRMSNEERWANSQICGLFLDMRSFRKCRSAFYVAYFLRT